MSLTEEEAWDDATEIAKIIATMINDVAHTEMHKRKKTIHLGALIQEMIWERLLFFILIGSLRIKQHVGTTEEEAVKQIKFTFKEAIEESSNPEILKYMRHRTPRGDLQ